MGRGPPPEANGYLCLGWGLQLIVFALKLLAGKRGESGAIIVWGAISAPVLPLSKPHVVASRLFPSVVSHPLIVHGLRTQTPKYEELGLYPTLGSSCPMTPLAIPSFTEALEKLIDWTSDPELGLCYSVISLILQ